MTIVNIYRNKRNSHKYIEIHNDGQSHNTVRQYMEWENGVKNFTGDKKLYRWRINNLKELLKDYYLINSINWKIYRQLKNKA